MAIEPKNMSDVVFILRALRAGALRELEALEEFLDEVVHRARSVVDLALTLDVGLTAIQPLADQNPRAALSLTTVRDRSAALNFVANQVLGTSIALRNHVARWRIRRPPNGFRDDLN